jgi:putative ABC transport system ATP-binding protein
MKARSFIQVDNVSKFYKKGKQQVGVLENFSVTIDKGEFVVLMGPSGAGKTTLLNMLGGLDKPSTGTVHVGETKISELSNSQLTKWRANNIGFIFQFNNLIPVLTAQQNVELPLLLTKLSGQKRKENAQTALQLVGLSERTKHFPKELSGGQEQRVAIARAIVTDPDILLCDEPTGDLDRKTADEVLGLLQTLNQKHGKTIIMVTHDPQAAAYASRSIEFDKAGFINQGETHDI